MVRVLEVRVVEHVVNVGAYHERHPLPDFEVLIDREI